KAYFPAAATSYPDNYKKRVLGLIQERLKFLAEIQALSDFFFSDLLIDKRLIDENKQLSKLDRPGQKALLDKALAALGPSDFTLGDLRQRLNQLLEDTSQKPGVLFSLIRIATTWAPASPGLAETLNLLGKDRSLERLRQSIEALAV